MGKIFINLKYRDCNGMTKRVVYEVEIREKFTSI